MKRAQRRYMAEEITYTFTREEVIAALCHQHDINRPGSNTAQHSYQAYDAPDGGMAIRLRWENAVEPELAGDAVFHNATTRKNS